jgi:hypothetical protein
MEYWFVKNAPMGRGEGGGGISINDGNDGIEKQGCE